MAKRGGTKHLKRIAAPNAIPIHDRKANVWLVKPLPGSHKKTAAVPLLVLIRDVLGLAVDSREAKKIINGRFVEIDGTVRTELRYSVGLMDCVSFPSTGKTYRMIVDTKGRLLPFEIKKDESGKKIAKILSKHTYNGKIVLHFHDGRNVISSDSSAKVGDSVVLDVPDNKVGSILKLGKGARCFITEGKHVGVIAQLEELIERKNERRGAEAKLSTPSGEFITVANYLLVVDDKFKVE